MIHGSRSDRLRHRARRLRSKRACALGTLIRPPPPPSPPNVDIEEVVGVDNPTTAGQVARVELPPDDGSAQALAPRKLVYPQQNVDQSTVPQAPAFLSKRDGEL